MAADDDHPRWNECGDKHCDRFPCVVFKEGYGDGWRHGYDQGYGDGFADGAAAGYADGFAAGVASASCSCGG